MNNIYGGLFNIFVFTFSIYGAALWPKISLKNIRIFKYLANERIIVQ